MNKLLILAYNEQLYIKDTVLKYINNFEEIITPVFESTELFKKPLGENSDVVLKEMYTFKDRNEDELTLRPEYTTPMIRAAISNGLKLYPGKINLNDSY